MVVVWAFGGAGAEALGSDPRQEAETLVRRGIELRKVHDDEAAARAFKAAYDLAPTPRAAAQLGLAKQAIGLWAEAERYLTEAVRAADDPWVARNHAALDEALAIIFKHLGRIEVIGDPQGAEVAVNGRAVGRLPLTEAVRVAAGVVDVDVHAPGYHPTQRTVTIVGGQYQRLVIHLAKADVAPVPVAKSSAPQERPEDTPPASPNAVATGPSGAHVALKWTAAGLAIAGLATGVTGTVLHSHYVSEFDQHPCRNKGGIGVLVDGTPNSRCQSLLETFRTDRTIAIVGYVSAGVFAAAWLALFLTEPSPAAQVTEQADRRFFCAPGLGTVNLSCAARF